MIAGLSETSETIIGRAKEAKFYCLIFDETSEALNKEQMLFCLRYVNDNADICDFVKIIHCESVLTGKIYNEVTEGLHSFGLDLQIYCGHGYDHAGAVSGHVNELSESYWYIMKNFICVHSMDVIKDISYLFLIFLLFKQNIYKLLLRNVSRDE